MTYVLVSLALLTPAQHRHCRELFTPAMGERAAQVIYRETRHVTRRNLRLLGYIERCQQRPGDQARVRSYDHHQSAMHEARLAPPLDYATASWYDDQTGQTASGYHSYYGVAEQVDGLRHQGAVRLSRPGGRSDGRRPRSLHRRTHVGPQPEHGQCTRLRRGRSGRLSDRRLIGHRIRSPHVRGYQQHRRSVDADLRRQVKLIRELGETVVAAVLTTKSSVLTSCVECPTCNAEVDVRTARAL